MVKAKEWSRQSFFLFQEVVADQIVADILNSNRYEIKADIDEA